MRISVFMVTAATAAALAAPAAGETPKTAGEKKAYQIYQKSVRGDDYLAAGKFGDAAVLFATNLDALMALTEEDGEVEGFELEVGAAELQTVRALKLGYDEIEDGGKALIRVDRFAELLEELAFQAQLASKGNPDYSDGQIADEAIRVIKELTPPIAPAETPSAQARLSLAVAKLDGAIKRTPSIATKGINGTTGAAALKQGRDTLAAVSGQAKRETAKSAAAAPQGARIALDLSLEQLGKIEADLNKDGFVADGDFEDWIVDPSDKLKTIGGTIRKAYDQEGKAMPADATKPLSDKAAELKALALRKAGGFSFPSGLVPDADIEGRVKGQLVRNVAGVKVLRIGMEGNAWGINKNALGIPESRYRYGYALYQMPGEQFPRCSRFSYRETYDGVSYAKADGASAYSATRWQSAK